jgi:integrase
MASYETRKGADGKLRYRGKYLDPTGKKHPGPWGPSKKQALVWGRDEEAKIRSGTWFDENKGRVTLAAYFEEWLGLRNYEVNTRRTYRCHFNAGLNPALGQIELRKFDSGLIQRWVAQQVADGVSPTTIRARFKTLQTVLAAKKGVSAVRDKLIPLNPCLGVDLPYVDETEVVVYEIDEAEALCEALGPWWAPLPMLASETAMRWGELMGLTVGDFTEDYTVIRVHHTIIEVSKADTGNGTPWMWKPRPKGRKARSLAIGPEAQALVKGLIRSRRLFAETDRLFTPPSGKDDGLGLRTEEWPQGRPIYRGTFRDRWNDAHIEAGVEQGERTFHSLKGSNLSWALDGGANLADVQVQGDHKQITTTQRYLTALEGANTRMVDALAEAKRRSRARKQAQ